MIVVFMLKLIGKLPFWLLYFISDFSSTLLRLFYRRGIITTNIRVSFPEKSAKELAIIRKQCYKNFMDVFVENLKTISIPKEELLSRITFVNADILKPYLEKKQSIFLLSSHQCNYEWVALAAGLRLPMPLDYLYKPHANEFMEEYRVELLTKFGVNLVPCDSAMMQLMRNKNKSRIINILADQVPLVQVNKFWTSFLNQPTAFCMEPEQLPKFTAFPVFFSHIWRTSRGHYNVELVPIAKPPYTSGKIVILPKYAEEAEILIRKHPADWHWADNRWKYPPPESADKTNQINIEEH